MFTALQQLLGDLPKSQFVAETLFRQPFSRTGAAREFCEIGSWSALVEILDRPNVDTMIVRRGEQHVEQVKIPAAPSLRHAGREEIAALVAEGYTLLVRHAEKHSEALRNIAADFARDFAAPVNVHMYATPAGEWGFPWHYDAEEVFIVQTSGRKEYSLRKNTVNPWPLEETLPADMKYEREIMPLMRVELAAGDWLYIPGGWWHKAETRGDEVALSLAIGVMPRTAIDIIDHLRAKLRESMLWRQRLPIVGDAGDELEAAKQMTEIFTMLGEDFRRELQRAPLMKELRDVWRG
jgi:ribosomal protein L16 Arg81 hydroxylase